MNLRELVTGNPGERSDELSPQAETDEYGTVAIPGCSPTQEESPQASFQGEWEREAPQEESAGWVGSETPTSKPFRLSKKTTAVYSKTAGTLFKAVGGLANKKTQMHPWDETWIPTDEEVDGVADATGRIIARRAPLPGSEDDANDIVDAIAVAVGLAFYLARNLMDRYEMKQKARASEIPAQDQGDVYDQATQGG